jgi:Lar family restriction alleviation protein
MNNDLKLKLCPFCGGKAEVDTFDDWGLGYSVQCTICNALMLTNGDQHSEAIKEWNRRYKYA